MSTTRLHFACCSIGSLSEVLSTLQQHKCDYNEVDHIGRTALHISAQNGKLVEIEVLVSYGANFSAKDNNGRTPMDMAIDNDKIKCYRFLMFQLPMFKWSTEHLLEYIEIYKSIDIIYLELEKQLLNESVSSDTMVNNKDIANRKKI